ncbi:MAG: hypothetical protein FWC82_03200 [Firmicutes bacterium]|nr:hypothetical protein [Bacillota bacterium]
MPDENLFAADVRRIRGIQRTPEQVKMQNYFRGGCMAPKDAAFDEIFSGLKNGGKFDLMAVQQRAIEKIGLDLSEISEIPPLCLDGFLFPRNDAYALDAAVRRGRDGFMRSSRYEIVWLFFSAKQVYLYDLKFSLTTDNNRERTEEYFYKDITGFSSENENIEVKYCAGGCMGGMRKTNMPYNNFKLSVPGTDPFYCPYGGWNLDQNKIDEVEARIQGMKQKLREKKS